MNIQQKVSKYAKYVFHRYVVRFNKLKIPLRSAIFRTIVSIYHHK